MTRKVSMALESQLKPPRKEKRTEFAMKECENYDWGELADTGKDLTVVELKYYLTGHNLPVSGKKEALCDSIAPSSPVAIVLRVVVNMKCKYAIAREK
ncbi:ATP-dependent DNA helicase 2 subunit KU70 [Trifolium medium]|uniref:ATP-dependent DNA helicase 2 subunit KU70 n=1 Tax=Trifolium medium TaxID=97028 RepID=A0A392MGN2_9FABA|nr:ATP-dependent DNA helicase 2 subunit KU70 [Trifolium medium]